MDREDETGRGDKADRSPEAGRSPEANRDAGDAVVAYWTGLDRGWQALWFGLAVVAAHLLVQPFL